MISIRIDGSVWFQNYIAKLQIYWRKSVFLYFKLGTRSLQANNMDEKARILQLRKELHQHNYNYYILNAPTVTDQEFDMLMHELMDLERKHPEMADANSPSVRVGSDLSQDFVQSTRRPCCRSATPTHEQTLRTFTTA